MKYIIYLTINTVNNKIYIGVHKTTTPYEFDGYLGCGVKIADRSTYRNCTTPFEYAVNKYGPKKFVRKTLYVFNSLEDALLKEKEIVNEEFIQRKDTYNVAIGGGLPLAKTKTIYQYDLNGKFIKKWESITEASIFYKCSSSCIGRAIFDRTPSLKFLWTDTKYDILDVDSFNIDMNKTQCYLYDINGDLIQNFKSLSDCSKYCNVDVSKISKAIRGKFCINKTWYCSDLKLDKFPITPITKHTIVYQYDLQGNFIQSLSKWDSSVYASIRLGNANHGFQYSWEYVPKMKELKPLTKARKVGKYSIDGELLQVFNTVRDAKKDTCGSVNVLSGNRKTAGGFIWKYIED